MGNELRTALIGYAPEYGEKNNNILTYAGAGYGSKYALDEDKRSDSAAYGGMGLKYLANGGYLDPTKRNIVGERGPEEIVGTPRGFYVMPRKKRKTDAFFPTAPENYTPANRMPAMPDFSGGGEPQGMTTQENISQLMNLQTKPNGDGRFPVVDPNTVGVGLPGQEGLAIQENPNLVLNSTAPQEKKGIYDNWKTPVFGNMPLDQFVQLTGMMANAIAPNEWSGRLGGQMAEMAGQVGRDRREYEERKDILDDQNKWREKQYEDLRREKLAERNSQLAVNKNLPLSMRKRAAEAYVKYHNEQNPDFQMSADDFGVSDGLTNYIQSVQAIDKDKTLTPDQKREAKFWKGVEAGVISGDKIPDFIQGPSGDLSYHMEKEQLGGQRVQDYRVFTDKSGQVVSREPVGKPYANTEAVARVRVEGYANTRTVNVHDKKTGITQPLTVAEYSELRKADPTRYSSPQYDEDVRQGMAEAQQRAGSRALNVESAYKMYSKEAEEIKKLRKKVQNKGLLPSGGFKDLNALNQWLGRKVSDPDMVELNKKTKFLADSLQRTIGGTQGGQWAFEVAADILDPTYSPEAFNRVVDSHGKAMKRMAESIRSFGKEDVSTNSELLGGVNTDDITRELERRRNQGK